MAKMTIIIPDDKVAELKLGFLAKCPVPVGEEGKFLYTDNEWIRQWIIKAVFDEYKEGKRLLAIVEIDDKILE